MGEEHTHLKRLPIGVFSVIANQLRARDQAALRLACTEVGATVDRTVEQLHAACSDLQQLARLLSKLTGLKELHFSPNTELSRSYKCYSHLQSHVPALVKSLEPLTALTSIGLSSTAAQQLGALKWARREARHAVYQPGSDFNAPDIPGSPTAVQPSPLDTVYWVPDWLAAAPNVRKLLIEAPAARSHGKPATSSSSSSGSSNVQPAWLWLNTRAWAHSLTSLHLYGVSVTELLSLMSLQQLTALQQLCLSGCRLSPTALGHLLQQLGSCRQLTSLQLPGNDMWLLPKGWTAVAGLQELDLSHNVLLELPPGLSCLTQLSCLQLHHNSLTALAPELAGLTSLVLLNASHNWLSGARGSLQVLLGAWEQLAVLVLDNVSDKRGELSLPQGMGSEVCRHLQELSVADNFSLDWSSLLAALPRCKGLRVLRVSGPEGHALEDTLRALLPYGTVEVS